MSRLSVLSAGDQSATDENDRIIIPPPGWVVEKVERGEALEWGKLWLGGRIGSSVASP